MTAPPARPHVLPRQSTHFSIRSRDVSGDWWNEDVDDDAWDSASDHEIEPQTSSTLSVGKQGAQNRIGSGLRISPAKQSAPLAPSLSSNPTSSKPIPVSPNGRRSPRHQLISNLSQSNNSSPSTIDQLQSHPSSSNSGGNLSFSYTHVYAPSPSSYPPNDDSPLAQGKVHDPEAGSLALRQASGWTLLSRNQDDSHSRDTETEDSGQSTILSQSDTLVTADELVVTELEVAGSEKRTKPGKSLIRPEADQILNDPLYLARQAVEQRRLRSPELTASTSSASLSLSRSNSVQAREKRDRKEEKFQDCLLTDDININSLKTLAWSGIPKSLRPTVWPILLGYFPLSSSARVPVMQRKRQEYQRLVELTFAKGKDNLDQQIWHQIEIDVPRTRPGVRLWMEAATQRSLERILYVWAIRHPTSGYVQGINDLATPFFQIFLSAYIDADPEDFDPSVLSDDIVTAIEADSFWCLVKNTIRMWDTYLSEGPDAFSQFHLYVCSAFLVKWSQKLRQMDFQGIIMFLQSLPTQGWTDDEIELLLSEAFVLSTTWANAQSHFIS
ncbi:GTPase-activating protein [Tulasnella sp. 419]|nr:GTPase-activating protein [Tulasnella sp. 419]